VIVLPSEGKVTLSLSYYFAHLDNASPADFFRVQVVGSAAGTVPATVVEELGSATNRDAAFLRRSVDISAFAGQSVRILIEAGDLEGGSLVEAAVDDVVIERQ
jgi:aminopeptidase S